MSFRQPMKRPRFGAVAIAATVAAVTVIAGLNPLPAAAAPVAPTVDLPDLVVDTLKVEDTTTPLGLDVERPRFSWNLHAAARGSAQTQYRVIVSSTQAIAESGQGDVWDSGPVASPTVYGVAYDGPALAASTRYHWRVESTVAGGGQEASAWSDVSWFETGLGADGWNASSWISRFADADPNSGPLDMKDTRWFWYPDGQAPQAPSGTRYFRLPLAAVADGEPVSVDLLATADNSYTIAVDGVGLGGSPDDPEAWRTAQRYTSPVTADSVIAVTGNNVGAGYAGVLVKVRLHLADGRTQILDSSNTGWVSSTTAPTGWSGAGFDDSSWMPVADHGAYGSSPWGTAVTPDPEVTENDPMEDASWIWTTEPGAPEVPAGTRYFRKTIEVAAGLTSAELIMTADDTFQAFLDGAPVAASPTATEPWRAAQRVALTGLTPGNHVVAAEVKNTAFAGGADSPAGLVGAVILDYADGSTTIVPTSSDWLASDAPAENWTNVGFDDSAWEAAAVHAAFGAGPWGGGVDVPDSVANARTTNASLYRDEFVLDKPIASGRLYVTAGGLVDARLNGAPVSDEVLSVSHTDVDQTVHYATHDVTGALRDGANALQFELGRGFYSMTTTNAWNWDRAPWVQPYPTVRAVLRVAFTDGSVQLIGTNGSDWRRIDGPTVFDSLYEGDFYDARRATPGSDEPGFDDSSWAAAVEVAGPKGELTARTQPPITVAETLAPTSIVKKGDGKYVVTFPRELAGWARISVEGAAGTTVTLRYGERLKADGNVESQSGFSGGEFQTDKYTLAGNGLETWEPKFSYKGFQYVEVTGWPGDAPTGDDILARVVHTDVDTVSTFDTSEALFDKIHDGVVNTMLNNFHHIPTDTPAYEKNGWTGDAQLGTEMFLRNFDAHSFLAKYVGDIGESRMEDGRPALIAPDPDWRWPGSDESPVWNAAYVLIPWWLYEYTGDRRVLEENYDGIMKYVRLEHSKSEDHISSTGLGDYMAPEQVGNPTEDMDVSATAYVYEMTTKAADMADLLGHPEDAAEMRAEAALIKDAFNTAYYRPASHTYRDGSSGYRQTQNLLALAFGLVPAGDEQAVADGIADDIVTKRNNHLWTGVLGTKYILPILTTYGYGDLAYTVATQTTFPSWGAWFESAEGATSMWESWGDYRSRNHYFLGTIDDWFFKDLVGVEPTAPGFAQFDLAPQAVGDLTSASGTTPTPFGDIVVDWTKEDGVFTLDADVPTGTTALVTLPLPEGHAVFDGDVPVPEAAGVEVVSEADGSAVLRVGSGDYHFTVSERASLDIVVTATSRCLASKVVLSVTATNGESVPVQVELATPYGTKAFATVAPGKNAFNAFTTRLGQMSAGTATATATGVINGVTTSRTVSVPFDGRTCG